MVFLSDVIRGAAAVLAAAALWAQPPLAPEVQEARLGNGIRVLLVERPSNGMISLGLFFRGGSADTLGLPPSAARLLVRSLFSTLRAEDLGEQPELDAQLLRADNLREAIRIEDLQRDRAPGAAGGQDDIHGLRASLKDALERITRLTSAPGQPDLLDELGAVHRRVKAEPDALVSTLDLPASALADWAGLEARRLRALRLSSLPRQRQRLEADAPEADLATRLLAESALPGVPYGRVLEPGGEAGVLLPELKAYARAALAPGRMAIVIAGGVKLAEVRPVLEAAFGALPAGDSLDRLQPDLPLGHALGPKRILVKDSGASQLRLAWPVPSLTHPDRLALEVLALLMGRRSGGQGLALPSFLMAKASLGVPGGRLQNLFVVEARPEEGHGLAECEREIQRTILRLQEESVNQESLEGALRRMELESLSAQADPETLVGRLGMAWCQGGDWRLAFPDLRAVLREGPVAVTRVARKYLRPDSATLVLLEPEFARDPGDSSQVELLQLLRAKALARLGDPLKAEALALQSMEQLRMLSREQRENLARALRQSGDQP
jgi:predicted Zn-dependent peptidase